MTNKSYLAEYAQAVAADHEILSRTVESARKLFTGEFPSDPAQEFTALRQMLGRKLPDHFTYEERRIFPALLADHPTEELNATIQKLIEDHDKLLARIRILQGLLLHRTAATCTPELWTQLLDFFEDLEEHTGREDALFRQFSTLAGR